MLSNLIPIAIALLTPLFSSKFYDLQMLPNAKIGELVSKDTIYEASKSPIMIAVACAYILLSAFLYAQNKMGAVVGLGFGGLLLLAQTIVYNWYNYKLKEQVTIIGASLVGLIGVGIYAKTFFGI